MTNPQFPDLAGLALGAHAYHTAEWRLIIDDAPRDGAWNMAVDEALMNAVGEGESLPVLRLYQWAPPCISLGRRQPLAGVDPNALHADGVGTVRRETGGWAILHTDELTYSVTLRPTDPRADGPILDAYRKLSQGLVEGLALLGVHAEMKPASASGTHNLSAACFETPSAYEITAGGRKLIGSAQARPNGRVLQHGSLPLRGDISRVTRYLAFPDEEARAHLADQLRAHAITLAEVAGREIGFEEASRAISAGFSRALNLTLRPSALTSRELEQAGAIAESKRLEMTA
ncbi:MAG TPA: lipoate--protein ligase family protein [Ktedonobacterales bacterium]